MASVRAQASLDFLMTYGWALLLIALAAAAIVALGIVDTGSFIGSRATGFSQITPAGWSIDSTGMLKLKLKNNAGSDIGIFNITAVRGTETVSNATIAPASPVEILQGNDAIVSLDPLSAWNPGTSYSVKVNIGYYADGETDFEYTDSGTLTGKVV
ncbi:MAG: hypothetical protein WC717_00840 [Candidatus Micrarchaeia archaeon]|jgi:hypothetical protein